jgi:hypothetical protein
MHYLKCAWYLSVLGSFYALLQFRRFAMALAAKITQVEWQSSAQLAGFQAESIFKTTPTSCKGLNIYL